MKSLALTFALATIAAGCGSDGNSNGDMSIAPDLSVASAADMTANDDLSTMTGCHGLASCLQGCKGDATCDMACRANATMMAKRLYKTLNDCRLATCYAQDGGSAPCAVGVPNSASCMLCLKDADTAPGTCTSGTTSWCGACYSEFTACANDLP